MLVDTRPIKFRISEHNNECWSPPGIGTIKLRNPNGKIPAAALQLSARLTAHGFCHHLQALQCRHKLQISEWYLVSSIDMT